MIFDVNDIVINNPALANGLYLDEDVLGLSIPGIRTSSGNYAGRPGGYIGAQLPGARQITLVGRAFGNDVTDLANKKTALIAALTKNWTSANPRYSVTLKFTDYAGRAFIVYATLIDFDMPIKRNKFESPFKIELFAEDINIYDNATGTALTATVGKRVSGGYTYPVVYPVVYGAGTAPTTVSNAGNVSVYPTITLTGSASNPVIANLTTGEFLGFQLTMAAGDVLVINMRDRTAVLNGGNVYGLITANSTFWRLPPGGSDVSLTTSSGSDTVSALVSWRSGSNGI